MPSMRVSFVVIATVREPGSSAATTIGTTDPKMSAVAKTTVAFFE